MARKNIFKKATAALLSLGLISQGTLAYARPSLVDQAFNNIISNVQTQGSLNLNPIQNIQEDSSILPANSFDINPALYRRLPSIATPDEGGISISIPQPQDVLQIQPSLSFLGEYTQRGYGEYEQGYEYSYISIYDDVELDFLTYTLGQPLGAVGFDSDYIYTDEFGRVDIVITFQTPSSTSLRLLAQEGRLERLSLDFEDAALSAHNLFESQLESLIVPFGLPQIEITSRHFELFNGIFAYVYPSQIEALARLDGVYSIQPNIRIEPQEVEASISSLGVSSVFDRQSPQEFFMAEALVALEVHDAWDFLYEEYGIDKPGYGVRIAVLDTGIDYYHPLFYRSIDEATGRIRGWDYIDNDNDPMEALPGQLAPFGNPPAVGPTSHGTHVAGSVLAIAPYATQYHFRVLHGSTPTQIIIDGLEHAHRIGVDIVNMSLGGGANQPPFGPLVSAVNIASLDGVVVVISAGNNGAGTPSLGSPSVAPLSFSVASAQLGGVGFVSTQDSSEILLNGDILEYFNLRGQPFIFSSDNLGYIEEYFYLGNLSAVDNLGISGFAQYVSENYLDGGDLEGKLAVILRGATTFVNMRYVANALNAAGFVIIDNQPPQAANSLQNINTAVDGFGGANLIPVFDVLNADLHRFGQAFTFGYISLDLDLEYEPLLDNISAFSSRGPVLGTFQIKPDITGPGSRIVSTIPSFVVDTNLDRGYNEIHYYAFGTSSGTSMSAPAIAGVAALVLNAHPYASSNEVRARIMNTARQLEGTPSQAVVNAHGFDGYSVFNTGAGYASALRAVKTTDAFATVYHEVPLGTAATNPGWTLAEMASLSFGSVYRGHQEEYAHRILTTVVHNTQSIASTSVLYNNPNDLANLSIVDTRVVGNNLELDVQITLYYGLASGFISEGLLAIELEANNIITIPFAARYAEVLPPDSVSLDPGWIGILRPVISGHITSYPGQEDIREITNPNVGVLTLSNISPSRLHIQATPGSGAIPLDFYAISEYGDEYHLLTFNGFPINGSFVLTDFLRAQSSTGQALPQGVYSFAVRSLDPQRPIEGNNIIGEFVVTSERPEITFDSESVAIPEGSTSFVVHGNVFSFGHDAAIENNISSPDPSVGVFDYTNTWAFVYYNGIPIGEGRVASPDGYFSLGFNIGEGFERATLGLRIIDADGVVGNSPVGSNISLLTEINVYIQEDEPIFVPGPSDGFVVQFGAYNEYGGDIIALLDAQLDIANLTVSGRPIPSGARVPALSRVMFLAVADLGYRFTGHFAQQGLVEVPDGPSSGDLDDIDVVTIPLAPFFNTSITRNVSITARFERLPRNITNVELSYDYNLLPLNPGDSLQLEASVSDQFGLEYLGYELNWSTDSDYAYIDNSGLLRISDNLPISKNIQVRVDATSISGSVYSIATIPVEILAVPVYFNNYDGIGGEVLAYVSGALIQSGDLVDLGETLNLVLISNPGYTLGRILINGSDWIPSDNISERIQLPPTSISILVQEALQITVQFIENPLALRISSLELENNEIAGNSSLALEAIGYDQNGNPIDIPFGYTIELVEDIEGVWLYANELSVQNVPVGTKIPLIITALGVRNVHSLVYVEVVTPLFRVDIEQSHGGQISLFVDGVQVDNGLYAYIAEGSYVVIRAEADYGYGVLGIATAPTLSRFFPSYLEIFVVLEYDITVSAAFIPLF